MAGDGERVVVVGGGIAGLTTAWLLAARGVPSTVLEAGPRLGGRIRTVTWPDGSRAEAGLEEVWQSSPAFDLVRALGLGVVETPGLSSVAFGDRIVPLTEPESFLSELFPGRSRHAFARWNEFVEHHLVGLTAARAGANRPAAALLEVDLRQFVVTNTTDPAVRAWVELMVETEAATAWDRISAADGLDELRPFVSTAAQPLGEPNARVRGGNEAIIDALLAALPEGTVNTGARVKRVVDSGPEVRVHYDDDRGRTRVVSGACAALAVPVWALRSMDIEPGLSAPARRAIDTTASGSYVKVLARVRRDAEERWPAAFAALPLLTDGPAGCVYRNDVAPGAQELSLTFLVHGRRARALAGAGSDVVARLLPGGCERRGGRAGRNGRATPLDGLAAYVTEVQVVPHVHGVGHWPVAAGRSRFDALADALRQPHGRVLIGGDTTESSHSDGAVRSAHRMVALALHRMGATPAGRRT
jgi:monoamine oxidase